MVSNRAYGLRYAVTDVPVVGPKAAGVKAMLNAMGMIENKLRLPLVPTRIKTFEAMRKILNELNIKC